MIVDTILICRYDAQRYERALPQGAKMSQGRRNNSTVKVAVYDDSAIRAARVALLGLLLVVVLLITMGT